MQDLTRFGLALLSAPIVVVTRGVLIGRILRGSDMPGDHLRRWSATDGVTTFRKPCAQSNGLTWDRQGRLLACEHATSQVTVTLADGSTRPIATHWNDKQLNSPNDIVC